MPKRAFVKCSACQRDFLSPIQVPEGANVAMSGNTSNCPHCNARTSIDNPFWKETA